MRLYFYAAVMLVRKYVFRQSTGKVICSFAEKMGVVYIKIAQILAMQNIDGVFSEEDRQQLAQICDRCNPLPFSKMKHLLENEYHCRVEEKFQHIDPLPLGSASISQVHRAVLKTGEEVALKIKRPNVLRKTKRDIKQIRRFMHRFGRFVGFSNLLGGDEALENYLNWIMQEADFVHERQNIQNYQEFAENVNGKIAGAVQIKTPKLYQNLCTTNVIVMQYISTPTINKIPLTTQNKQRIARAENDYIRLSFYALLHNLPVVFHGDPHSGNIYIDEVGNIGFLDMGLVFQFDATEVELTRKLFLNSYIGKADRIVDWILSASTSSAVDRAKLTHEMEEKVSQLRNMPVAQFFVEMIGVFTQYNIAVPPFLFKMAKAFLALFGLGTITNNFADTKSLLADQVKEFYLSRTFEDLHKTVQKGLQFAPNATLVTMIDGPLAGFGSSLTTLADFGHQLQVTAENCLEVASLLERDWTEKRTFGQTEML